MEDGKSNPAGKNLVTEQRIAFNFSLARLIIGGGLTAGSFLGMYQAVYETDYVLPVLALLLAVYILIGGPFLRYRPVRAYGYLMSRMDHPAQMAASSGGNSGRGSARIFRESPEAADLTRRLKIVFLLRMLILVGIAAFVVVALWLEKREHSKKYGYDGPVSIRYEEDGTRIVTPIE